MNREQLLLAIQDTNSSIEFLGARFKMARNEMHEYGDQIEESENYLEELQAQLDECEEQ